MRNLDITLEDMQVDFHEVPPAPGNEQFNMQAQRELFLGGEGKKRQEAVSPFKVVTIGRPEEGGKVRVGWLFDKAGQEIKLAENKYSGLWRETGDRSLISTEDGNWYLVTNGIIVD